MSALTIVQTACSWLALPIPQAVFSSTDAQVIQLRSLLNEELTELRTWPDMWWRKLLRQWTFQTDAALVQTQNPLPDDLGYVIANTMWDRTQNRPVVGPVSPQAWQAYEAQPIFTSVIYGFRLRGNDFLTAPPPPAGDTVAYEYISNLAVYSLGTATVPDQQYFTADSDTSIFEETLIERGLRWRFEKAKGLPYAQDYDAWLQMLQRFGARDKGMPTLNTASPFIWGIPGPYTPPTNFPGPS